MSYKITKKFGEFVYNTEDGSHKLQWHEVNDEITDSQFKKLTRATQLYCKKIRAAKKK